MTVSAQRVEPTKAGGIAILVALAVLSILAIPVLLVAVPLYFLYLAMLRLMVELVWVARGKRVLLVYSRSPVWEERIETTWLPRLGDRAVVLNWSDPDRSTGGSSLPAWILRRWAPPRNFTPGVVLFPGFLRSRQVGFYDAFRDWKLGDEAPLRKGEMELFEFVERGGR